MSATTALPRLIVVAVDGSDPSFKAAAYAIRLASTTKSKILVLHVILLPSYVSKDTLEKLRIDLLAKSLEIVSKAKSLAEQSGIEIDGKIIETESSVVKSIVDFAASHAADLIVVGSRGTSGMPKLTLGSVAAGVVSFAQCPVLAVR